MTCAFGCKSRQGTAELLWALEVCPGGDKLSHRQFRWNPGSSAAGVSRGVMHANLKAEPRRLVCRVCKQVVPFRAGKCNRSRGQVLRDVHEDHAPNSRALHCLEVRRDSGARHIAIDPKPIDPRPCESRRVQEVLPQDVHFTGESRANRQDSQKKKKRGQTMDSFVSPHHILKPPWIDL